MMTFDPDPMPRNFVGYGRRPPMVTWPGGARFALNFAINYEEGAEYSFPDDGRNETHGVSYTMPVGVRDLRLESMYEYGSRVGVWRVMRLFEEYDVKVTFFASAVAIERNPEVGALIREQGHEVAGHGWRWIDAWRLTEDEERDGIRKAVTSLERTCGHRPVGWNTRGGPTVRTRRLLAEHGGFLYDSDSSNDDLPYYVDVAGKPFLVIPYTRSLNDGRFVNAPTFTCASEFLDDCRRGLRYLWQESADGGRLATIALHTRLIGDPARTDVLKELLDFVLSLPGLWITRRCDIADWWATSYKDWHQLESGTHAVPT